MAKLKILTQGNPILRKKAKSLNKITPQIKKLIKNMEETMRKAPGVGLAAPQIGESICVIVADIGEGLVALINPKIVKKSGFIVFEEGCLSVPGLEAPVERYSSICVKALDTTGMPVKIDAKDFFAVVLQHEIDHLNGILFVDRVKDSSLIKIKEKSSLPTGRQASQDKI